MRRRTRANTRLTSRDTVDGEGSTYSGRPVFINMTKPRSRTIAYGRLLSQIHRTIHDLGESEKGASQIQYVTYRASFDVC